MTTFKTRIAVRFLSIVSFLILSAFELAGEMKEGGRTSATQNTIETKDFQFSPQTLKVKSGQSIT